MPRIFPEGRRRSPRRDDAPATLAVALALIAASGCYRFVPADPSEVTPPEDVRARLSEQGARQLGGPLNPDLRRIDGRLLRWDDDGIALEIATEVRREGFPPTTTVEVLELAPEHVATVERRQLDGWWTAGVVAVIVGGTVAAVLGTRTVGGGQDDPEQPTEEPEAAITFRIPYR